MEDHNMTAKVFIPQPIPPIPLEMLREYAEVEMLPWVDRAITEAEFCDGLSRADYLFGVPHTMPITAKMIAANPNLKGIAVNGINTSSALERFDSTGVPAAEAAGIPFLIAGRAPYPPEDAGGSNFPWGDYALNPRATADLMVAMVMNLAYRVTDADRYCRGTGWFQEGTMALMGQGCTGKTISVWGLGKVARHAVKRLRALEMNILYTKRTRLEKEEEEELGIEWVGDTDELIQRADYLSMLVNFEDANLKLMGEREFSLMKPSAYFINVGRARLVDEEAMIRALQNKTIAGAGIDVYWDEPPTVFNAKVPEALRKLDNVILTPHNGGATYLGRTSGYVEVAKVIIDDIIKRGGQKL
jgi:phosphoglycerate dehydrogenase-like enzyme